MNLISASRPASSQHLPAWAEYGPLIRQERHPGPAVHALREDSNQRMFTPFLPFLYTLGNPIKAEPGTLLVFQPFNILTHTTALLAVNLNTYTHTHTFMLAHTSCFFLVSFKDLGRACGHCSQKDDGKLVRTCHSAGFINFWCLFLCLWWLYFIHAPFLLILACPWGWLTRIMLMWANSADNLALLFHWFQIRQILYNPTFLLLAELWSWISPGKTPMEMTAVIWLAQNGAWAFPGVMLTELLILNALCQVPWIDLIEFQSYLFMTKWSHF